MIDVFKKFTYRIRFDEYNRMCYYRFLRNLSAYCEEIGCNMPDIDEMLRYLETVGKQKIKRTGKYVYGITMPIELSPESRLTSVCRSFQAADHLCIRQQAVRAVVIDLDPTVDYREVLLRFGVEQNEWIHGFGIQEHREGAKSYRKWLDNTYGYNNVKIFRR